MCVLICCFSSANFWDEMWRLHEARGGRDIKPFIDIEESVGVKTMFEHGEKFEHSTCNIYIYIFIFKHVLP